MNLELRKMYKLPTKTLCKKHRIIRFYSLLLSLSAWMLLLLPVTIDCNYSVQKEKFNGFDLNQLILQTKECEKSWTEYANARCITKSKTNQIWHLTNILFAHGSRENYITLGKLLCMRVHSSGTHSTYTNAILFMCHKTSHFFVHFIPPKKNSTLTTDRLVFIIQKTNHSHFCHVKPHSVKNIETNGWQRKPMIFFNLKHLWFVFENDFLFISLPLLFSNLVEVYVNYFTPFSWLTSIMSPASLSTSIPTCLFDQNYQNKEKKEGDRTIVGVWKSES